MEKPYEYRSEGFFVKQDESKCEYTVKHAKWAGPVMTIYIKPDQNPNVSRWAGKGPTVSFGADGSFQGTLDECCKQIIRANSKSPTTEERCQEGTDAFNSL